MYRGREATPLRVVSFASFLLIAGCSAFSGYPKNYQNTSEVISADAPYLAADVRTKASTGSDADRGGLSPQRYRDAVIYARLEVIDIYYYDFESHLVGSYDGLTLGSDLTTLILNGLGATTGSAATKAALAAASAGVIGANAAVNTDVFYRKTLPALVAQMRASRQTALIAIKSGLNKSVLQYSLDEGLTDINEYYVAGTLPSAVSQITSKAGAEKASADSQLAALRNVKYVLPETGSTALRIQVWLYPPDGDQTKNPISTSNRQLLTNWMQSDRVDPALNGLPIQSFLTGYNTPLGETDRRRAIDALHIP